MSRRSSGRSWPLWVLRTFRAQVVLRLSGILLALALLTAAGSREWWLAVVLVGLIVVWLVSGLVQLVETSNRQLMLFLESIRYADFAASFNQGSQLGPSFRQLNEQFNDVMTAFRRTRAEREENLRYLDTVVQHVSAGLLAFDASGKVELMNPAARHLLGDRNLRHLVDLATDAPELHQALRDTPSGGSSLIRLRQGNVERQYSLRATEFRMRGVTWKLVSMQDIQVELEQKEVEAWRNLARVLRHEIMNSITPISSLSGTIRQLLAEEAQVQPDQVVLPTETFEDLQEGLQTIEKRSIGLVQFVDAYRTFTTLPAPVLAPTPVDALFHRLELLLADDLAARGIALDTLVQPADLALMADAALLEMVLLNLVKNAAEAIAEAPHPTAEPRIQLQAAPDDGAICLEVVDNGPGIVPEALSKIFIPFYSTKRGGSGIGLAWSRQILHQHRGTLTVRSIPDVQTVFTLRIPTTTAASPRST